MRPLLADDREEFLHRLYVSCIRLGTASRAGLREHHSDREIDDGVPELLARGLLRHSERDGSDVGGDDGSDVGSDDGRDDVWEVPPPGEAVPPYLELVEQRAALTRSAVAELDNQWRRAVGRGTLASLPDLDVLSSLPEIIDAIVAMHRMARGRLWWALNSSEVTRGLLGRVAEGEHRLQVADGVDVRLVLDTAVLAEPWAPDLLERARSQGYAVRVGHRIPFGVLVGDEESVLVEISSFDPNGYGSLELRRKAAREAVISLFEEFWSRAAPFGPASRALQARGDEPVAPLDERDTRVLALLATGAADKVIARQIGASERTVERRVRYLMDHLGAATRFQAGVQAVRRGWV